MVPASAAAVMIIAVVIVTVTVVSAIFAAATAVVVRDLNACSDKFHFKSKFFSRKRMVCIERNSVTVDF